jgi:alpha-1,3-glucanase-like protein/F5/8 type C domain-containing protein/HYDIN/CFA65/VesB family protein/centrosomal CEP192-like protein
MFRPPTPRPRLRALVAVTASVIASSALAIAVGAGSAQAAAATGGAGATLPYVEQQAENAATNGSAIGPSYTQGQLADEASGRRAVTLSGQGKYVEFTLTAPANSIDFRYSIPDTSSGSVYTAPLSLYVNGAKQPNFTLTNAYSWYYGGYPFSNSPSQGNPHHFYDEVHRLLGSTLAAGTKVRLQVDAEDTASSYTIDLADFEQVGAAASQPANSLSITNYGADPSGSGDASGAFASAISAAQAQGKTVWIPSGTFRVNQHIAVNNVTIQGAGMWYSTVTGNGVGFYGNYPPTPSTNVHLSNFAIVGDVQERNDGAQVNGIGGAMSSSTVSDIWIEHTKVGAWMDGPMNGLTFSGMRIRDMTADGVNFHNGVTNSTVTNSDLRNLGDDALATWADTNADADDTFSNNTVQLPILANGIAIYGGHDNTVSGNRVIDAGINQGGGIHVAQRFASTPLGKTTVTNNTIIRSGDLDPNWQFGVGALWFDARDAAMSGDVEVNNIVIQQSPYEAIQFVSGSSITNVHITNATISGTGTFVVQEQVGGSATFTNVTATGVGGPAGQYNCGVGFTINDGGGNSGWNTTYCGPWPTPNLPADGLTTSPSSLAFGSQSTGTTSGAQSLTVTNSGSTTASVSSISTTGDFAQTNTCGSSIAAGASCTVSVTFHPTAAGTRTGALTITSNAPSSPNTVGLSGTGVAPGPVLNASPGSLSFGSLTVGTTSGAQTVTVLNSGTASATVSAVTTSGDFAQTNTCGTVAVGASCTVSVTFKPTTGGARSGTLTITSNANNSPTTVSLGGTGIDSNTDLAAGKPATASSYTQSYAPANVTDADTSSYWESANNAFPQWVQVDLGSTFAVRRLVLHLPPSSAWGTRTQTLSVLGSTDGSSFSTLVGSAGYTFDPASGNTVTITVPSGSARYVRLNITANTGWPAGQLSALQVFT